MRKKCLQVFSILLIVSLLLTAAPLTGMTELFVPNTAKASAVHSNSDLKYGSDNSITRVEWLHDLTVIFNMTVTDDNMPDNYFSDLEETDSYYYDVMLAVEFGVVDVEAGGEVKPLEKATREFAAQTLNFCLGYYFEEDVTYSFSDVADTQYPNDAQIALDRGWVALVDGKFMPELPVTSAEVKTMLADAETIYKGTIIDTAHKDSIVFKDNVIVIPSETESEIVNENTVTITDCPVALKKGDIFAVYDGNFPVAYHAENIVANGNVLTVTTSIATLDEAYEKYDVEGIMEFDELSVIPSENVEVETIQQSVQNNVKKIGGKKISGKKQLKNISAGINFSLGKGINVSGSCKMSNPTLEYKINTKGIYVVLIGPTDLSYSVEWKNASKDLFGKEIILCDIGVPLIGGFQVTFDLSLAGKASGAIKGTMVTGIDWKNGDHPRIVKGFQQDYSYVNAEVSVKAAVKAKLGVYTNPILNGYIYAEAGMKASAKKTTYGDEKKPAGCLEFSAHLFVTVGATGKIKLPLQTELSFDLSYDIVDKSNSPWRVVKHYDDGVEVATCGRDTRIGDATGSGDGYFTPGTSRNHGSGWSESSGSRYGYSKTKEPVVIFDYELDENKNATITKYYGNSYSVVIPSTIDGYTVAAIGKNSFANNTNLRSVVIPDTVTEINRRAFQNCVNIKYVSLSAVLSVLGANAFQNTALETVKIPKSLQNCSIDLYGDVGAIRYAEHTFNSNTYSVPAGPFYNCPNLKTVTFEKGVTTIPNNLFAGCLYLEKVVIPNTVTKVGFDSFACCLRLSDLTVGENVADIGARAFKNCVSINQLTLPPNITSLGAGAFQNIAIETVKIPKSLEKCSLELYGDIGAIIYSDHTFNDETYSIPTGPFYDCPNLKTVTFEKGITAIPNNLFAGCLYLEIATIPDTVTKVGSDSFVGCLKLSDLTIGENVTDIGARAFKNCVSINQLTLPPNITSLGAGAFQNIAVETVKIPKSLEKCSLELYGDIGAIIYTDYTFNDETYSIPAGPFYKCSQLKTVTFENGFTKIPDNIFAGCIGLETITFPSYIKSIGKRAFEGCLYLQQLNLNDQLEIIGERAFYCCPSLLKASLPESVNKIENNAFAECDSLETVSLPKELTQIGTSVFLDCSSLQSIKLSNTLQMIPASLFENCVSLKTIEIPSTVTIIQKNAFSGCSTLESFSFADNKSSLSSIQDKAFLNCTSLKIALLPESVTSVKASAFKDCVSLREASIPQSVSTLGNSVFQGDELLSKVHFSDYSIKQLPDASFLDCSCLESIILPKGLISIGSQAFKNNIALTSVTIPASVTAIASDAFSYPRQTTIYGEEGTYAETYANEKGMKFVDISVPATKISLAGNAKDLTVNNSESVRATFALTPNDSTDVITLTCDNSKVKIQGMDIKCASVGDYEITATTTSGLSYSFTLHVSDGHVHNYGKWTKLNDTQHYRVCADDSSHVEKENHKWNAGKETKAATCTSTGVKTYTCTVCSATKTETIGKTAHKLTKTAAKAATCTTAGNVEYYTCSVCKKTFSDAKGTKEIKEVTTAATGHNYEAWTKLNDTQHQRICANDKNHVEKADHTWDGGKVTKKATTEAAGEKTFTCTVCGATKTEQIDKLVPEEIKDKATNISVSFTTGAFSVEVVLKVQEIKETSQLLDEKYGSVKAFDISTFVGNKKVQPKSSVTVKIPVPKGYKVDVIAVYHIADNGQKEQIQIKIENGYIIFSANSFSIYAVVDTSTKVSVTLGDVDGDGNISAADARLALRRSVGLETYEEGSPDFLACDVDLDGNVSAADARLILRASVGLEDPKTWVK